MPTTGGAFLSLAIEPARVRTLAGVRLFVARVFKTLPLIRPAAERQGRSTKEGDYRGHDPAGKHASARLAWLIARPSDLTFLVVL